MGVPNTASVIMFLQIFLEAYLAFAIVALVREKARCQTANDSLLTLRVFDIPGMLASSSRKKASTDAAPIEKRARPPCARSHDVAVGDTSVSLSSEYTK